MKVCGRVCVCVSERESVTHGNEARVLMKWGIKRGGMFAISQAVSPERTSLILSGPNSRHTHTENHLSWDTGPVKISCTTSSLSAPPPTSLSYLIIAASPPPLCADYATASLLFLSAIVGVLTSCLPPALQGHRWASIVINANIWRNVLKMKYGVPLC